MKAKLLTEVTSEKFSRIDLTHDELVTLYNSVDQSEVITAMHGVLTTEALCVVREFLSMCYDLFDPTD